MKKNQTFTNYDELKAGLKSMKCEMNQIQENIKLDAKAYLVGIPKRISYGVFNRNYHHKILTSNPIGKIMSKTINSTILKKENFITKMLSSLFFKQVGKKVEHKLLRFRK
ncbi:hypothetical protein EZ428_13975 [Pedobacter frigiditerrae]|uniref:Uncharacterized protein n=1 Tax=Pedobacter frigiditerrae TaxID=2530452 RepID=A0A4R0MTH9_9SPHI|nr:hypothetical protein [Pedobacter frigiditerrae]TCC90379.1 hypothetical protein EZ428_13975 [Pedobacter frigiditerrae]